MNEYITCGKSRCQLPCLHEHWKVPRNNLSTNTHWFVPETRVFNHIVAKHWPQLGSVSLPSNGEVWTVNRDRLPVVLVGPTGVIAIALDGQVQINVEGLREWLAIVQGLQRGDVIAVSLNEVRKLKQQAASLRCIHFAPRRTQSEGLARSFRSLVHICLVPFLHLRDDLLSGGVDRRECLAGDALDELIVDEDLGLIELNG